MTSASIPGIHVRSNPYYSVLLPSFRLSSYHRRALGGFCQLLIYPIAYQYGLGVQQLHAFKAAFWVPRSVLQCEAVGLRISILLQKANPIFSLDLWCLWETRSQGRLAHNRCDAWGAFPSPCSEAATLLLRGWRGVKRIETGALRTIEHTATRQERHALMA